MVRCLRYRTFWSAFFILLIELAPFPFLRQAEALTVEEIALLKGPDRQKVLEQGAKKEGRLLWYSTLRLGLHKQHPLRHGEPLP